MNEYAAEKIRNVGVVSHGDVGKTSLVEAMLFSAGATNRLGSVDDGTTACDYLTEEISRKITIRASLAQFEWNKTKLNVIDTPGYSDFGGDIVSSLRVTESVVIMLSAQAGVEVGTESAWRKAKKRDQAAFVFINRMDKEHANFEKAAEMAQDRIGPACVSVQFPVNTGEEFNAVIDIIKMKMLTYGDTDGKYTESDIPADLLEKAETLRKQLEESVAENDEELMEKYFETEKLEEDELIKGLKKEIANRNIIPILCGAAAKNYGSHRLMDMLVDFAPSPADIPEVAGVKPNSEDEEIRKTDSSEPFSALVFKTIAEQHLGEMSFMRIYSGSISAGTEVANTSQDSNEKIGQLFFTAGKNRSDTPVAHAGDIVATVKLKKTHTGDTLADKKAPIILPKINFPASVIRTAVEPKNKGDEDKIGTGLNAIHDEDPTFIVKYDPEVKQTLMMGQGETQFMIAAKQLKDKYGVEVEMTEPRIPYRETIRKKVEAQGKFKKQSGGRGQYGDCHLRLEPMPRGEGFEFVDKVVGGVIPGKFIPAIEKGVREIMDHGILSGCQIVDVRASVFFGSYHAVDSSENSFKVAGSMAFKKAFMDAKPVLLEPIYDITVTVPEEYMGDVMGDISSRRGKIQGMEVEGPFQVIKAKVPLAELYKYSTTLRSLTQGRGLHKRAFSHYEEMSGDVQQKIIDAYQASKENG